jgi:hypothetical protein
MAESGEPRENEEAATSFDGMNESEDRIEAHAIGGNGFLCDDFAGDSVQRFERFGDEFL